MDLELTNIRGNQSSSDCFLNSEAKKPFPAALQVGSRKEVVWYHQVFLQLRISVSSGDGLVIKEGIRMFDEKPGGKL